MKPKAEMYILEAVFEEEPKYGRTTAGVSDDPDRLLNLVHSMTGGRLQAERSPSNAHSHQAWVVAPKVDEYGDGQGYPQFFVSHVTTIK
jgi:hypothetical protein